ncbi:hypothetical protein MKW92_036234 [Papaver armeniacum]|nr:hypothetical protein MKW92_036234 [Papaver armeniacum]
MATTSQIHYFQSLQKSSIFTTRKTPSYSLKSNRSSSIIICNSSANNRHISGGRKLRAAVIGGGPAGSSAAEALSRGGIETYLIERSPSGAKPCGGAIPLCMLDEFAIPLDLIDRRVTQMKIISPSNLTVDFGKTLKPHEYIAMIRREVLDSFLRSRAESVGTNIINALFTHLELPDSPNSPYTVHYNSNGSKESISVDVVIGADGANSRVAKSIDAGNYSYAIAFQERIRLPDEKMKYYENLAEMYVGNDISPIFMDGFFRNVITWPWEPERCVRSRILSCIRMELERVKEKIYGGKVIKVEAHPIPEHPRPRRVRGRVALVGDSAGYVTKCSGEGIYFAAKSGRMCGEGIVRASLNGVRMIDEKDLRKEYLRKWDSQYINTFRFLDILQKVFYGNNAARECLVEICGCDYVQRMTFESYLYKKLARGNPWEDVKMVVNTVGSLIRSNIIKQEMERLEV